MQNKLTDLQTLINSLPPDKQAIFISLTQQLHAGLISQQQFQEQAMALGFAPKRPGSPLDPANKRTRTDSPLPLQQPRWTTQAFSASPAQMPVLPSGYATPTAKRAIVDVNKLDVDSMMDVTSYGGVDLKEEELTMTDMLPRQRRALSHFKDTVFLNMKVLEKTVAHIGTFS